MPWAAASSPSRRTTPTTMAKIPDKQGLFFELDGVLVEQVGIQREVGRRVAPRAAACGERGAAVGREAHAHHQPAAADAFDRRPAAVERGAQLELEGGGCGAHLGREPPQLVHRRQPDVR